MTEKIEALIKALDENTAICKEILDTNNKLIDMLDKNNIDTLWCRETLEVNLTPEQMSKNFFLGVGQNLVAQVIGGGK